MLADVESDFLARVHPDSKVAIRVHVLDGAEITISDVQFFGWRGELPLPRSPGERVARSRSAAPSPKN